MKRDARLVRLSWDHHHGLVLALRIAREAPSADADGLGELYSEVIAEWSAEVLPHFHAEGECLLARLLRYDGAGGLIEQTARDHIDIQGLVADMRDAESDDARRQAMLGFGERLRDHIRWEEAELFQRSQEILSDAELDAMAHEVDVLRGPGT